MYVAPRPRPDDDPLFALRLALATAIAYAAALWLRPTMPMIAPALTAGIIAAMRGRFDPIKAVGGPVTMAVMMWVMAWLVALLRPYPEAMILVIGVIYTLAYTLILRTGNPLGMLILIAAAMMSIMGLNSIAGMVFVRDVFVEGAMVALCVVPLLYALLPPAARELAQEIYPAGSGGRYLLRGAIRGGVLLLLTWWLYTVVNQSNLMLAVAAIFVIVFPTRGQVWAEARERIFATVLGGALALLILAGAMLTAHLVNLLLMLLLASLFLGDRMVHGRRPPMVYQFALSAMIAIVGAALTTRGPLEATLLRIGLTIAGAIVAALLTSLLEALILGDRGSRNLVMASATPARIAPAPATLSQQNASPNHDHIEQ